MTTCPFNPAHVVAKHKLLNHINKCAKTTKNIHEFQTCQYNVMHYFRRGEAEEHYKTCKDANLLLEMLSQEKESAYSMPATIDNTIKEEKPSIPVDPVGVATEASCSAEKPSEASNVEPSVEPSELQKEDRSTKRKAEDSGPPKLMKTIKIEPEDTLSLPAPPKIGRGRGLLARPSNNDGRPGVR